MFTHSLLLFQDPHLIAVHKPVGLLTQAPSHVPSLEAQVKEYIKNTFAKPAGVYLGIPHRLDRPVEGVVLFCRNTKAAQRVALQFQQHTVQKTYWAWVEGQFPEDQTTWTDYLRKIPDTAKAEITTSDGDGAKEAVTGVRVLARREDRTLLELSPRTGRMHQLRLQSSSRGYPIIGDALYGSKIPYRENDTTGGPAIALLARRLSLIHPFRHEPLVIESLLPSEFITESWL